MYLFQQLNLLSCVEKYTSNAFTAFFHVRISHNEVAEYMRQENDCNIREILICMFDTELFYSRRACENVQ